MVALVPPGPLSGNPLLLMTAPLRRRTRAREIAMQALFQFDLRGPGYASELGGSVANVCRKEMYAGEEVNEDGLPNTAERALNVAEREIVEFATRLVEGTLKHRDDIDKKLQAVTRNWDLRRMAIVDRNVLRMSVFELMHCDDVPPKVAINEAIEIGKKYSTANSGGFVNGILDRIRIDLDAKKITDIKVLAEQVAAEKVAAEKVAAEKVTDEKVTDEKVAEQTEDAMGSEDAQAAE
ncbi:MAG: transcription antitermination factor NusB [Planctomycetota bacterium]|jgi:transcription antitermination factor NusB